MSMFHELMMKKKGMPERYQEVEYIENNSDTSGAYIDTGYKASSNTRLVVKCTLNASAFSRAGGHQLAGSDNGLTTQFGVGTALSQQSYRFQYGKSKIDGGASISPDTITIFDQNKNKCYIDGNLFHTFSVQTFNCSENTLLFTRQAGSTSANWNGKVYYCQIYDNNRLVRNFIPVYDTETQKYGMWESVQGKFYGNAGTGDFKGSIVGYTIVGSPTITDGVVSNLSANDYLQLPSVDLSNVNKFEINIGFTTNATNSANWNAYIMYFNDGKARYFGTDYQKKTVFITGSTSFTGNTTLSNSKFYRLKYVFTRNGNSDINLDIYITDNDGNFVLDGTFNNVPDITLANSFKLGTGGTGNNMASLDLNNTYIKINNKLWFNGQQA